MIDINKDDIVLINDILERNYFKYFKNPQYNNKKIEILLENKINSANQCLYLGQEKELYSNQDNIYIPTDSSKIENILMLVDWYIKNNFYTDIIVSGNIDFFDKTIIINTCEQIIQKFSNTCFKPRQIIIYTNLYNMELLAILYNLFKTINIQLFFKIQINGKYCDNNIYNDEFYNNVINFINTYPCEVNAHITSSNIYNWIDNYKWWISVLSENALDNIRLHEVLDRSWDIDALSKYVQFLDFQTDFFYEALDNKIFKDYIYGKNNNEITFSAIQIKDKEILTNKKYYKNCGFHNNLNIDIETMQIIPCHGLNYPDLYIGQFEIINNEIIKIIPHNIAMLVSQCHLKRSSTPHCEYCKLLNICEGPCYKNCYETSYNLFCPVKESCNLLMIKYKFLLFKYKHLNLLPPEDNTVFSKDIHCIADNVPEEFNYENS